MNYQRILVALDMDADEDSPAFNRALELAKMSKADLMILHCLRQDTSADWEGRVGTLAEMDQSKTWALLKERRQHTIKHVESWLHNFVKKAQVEKVDAEYHVAVGRRGQEICELAKQWEADLIVMGTPHRGSLADFLVGSISSYVLHNAGRSVFFVQER